MTHIPAKNFPYHGFIRLPEVLELVPVGRSTWWAGVKAGRFPQPFKLGPRTTVWRADDIYEIISDPQKFFNYQLNLEAEEKKW